ncbi:hypothetical protein NPIL_30861 [Nephila pilipes]|uniref:Uncharacterized protein n=1 Tax=Nephila pilipes TaxID=299642 RepID=A0A8X6QB36_NEPPI|nr:hypothetical protein NPIL_30861 [Nephila pilipes]
MRDNSSSKVLRYQTIDGTPFIKWQPLLKSYATWPEITFYCFKIMNDGIGSIDIKLAFLRTPLTIISSRNSLEAFVKGTLRCQSGFSSTISCSANKVPGTHPDGFLLRIPET